MEYEILNATGEVVNRLVAEEGFVKVHFPGSYREIISSPATPTVQEYTDAVQKHLDDEAKTRNYDSILSACSYATSTNPRFSAEGQACVAWRDAVWAECYTILELVQTGRRAPPTIPELLAALPAMTWPAV